jgi:hypothetical protein
MKKVFKAEELISFRDALVFQLSYGQGHSDKASYLRDIPNIKLQYCLDKNLEIIEKEVSRVEKVLGIADLLAAIRNRYSKESEKIKDEKAKGELGKKLDIEFVAERAKLLDCPDGFEVELYEFRGEMPDVDRSGFWIMKHFVPVDESGPTISKEENQEP